MNKETLFAKTLEEVKRTAKEQGNYIKIEQIEFAFKEIGLEKEQLGLVMDYLTELKIGIGEPLNPEDYLTGEEINYLDSYLEELKLLRQVTEAEKEAVTLSSMAGDVQAQERLMEIYLPQVVEIAKLYSGQGVYLEDLIGEGNVAVAAGVTMLGCLEHVCEAQGMLGKMVMDAMEDFIAANIAAGKAGKAILDKVNQVADLSKDLAETLQKKVTVEELAQETGMPEETILDAFRMSGGNIEYIEKER